MNSFAAIDFETANNERTTILQRKIKKTTIRPSISTKYSPLKMSTINNISHKLLQFFIQIVPFSEIIIIFAEISRL